MDVLSDVLDTVRLTSTVFVQAELPTSWGIRAKPSEHFAFHVISRGSCWLDVDGLASIEIAAGDVVVLAPGHGHALRADRDSLARDIDELLADGSLCRPVGGDSSTTTHLVCGAFRFDGAAGNLLAPVLPVVLHVRESAPHVGPWLAQTIELLAHESFTDRPGHSTVVNRLCDALFVYLLRSHLASLPVGESNWLRALDEPRIGVALHLMHDDPGQAWTVALLASRVGMSRSAFSARFAALVGEPPVRYLTRWRLQKAAAMLRSGDSSIDQIAGQVGYESVIAFNKAFKRTIGLPPGAYRRSARVADGDPARRS